MANKIKLKRGAEANLPILDVGEPAFTTDTKKPFIGSYTGNIELATKAQINDLDAEFSGLETNKAEKTYVDNQLELKRNKTDKITTNDIDKSSDANKIHLLDLAEEVQVAMAGTAPVISSVADGSITATKYADGSVATAKIADNAITGAKLATNYSYKSALTTEDLNTITNSGVYSLTAVDLANKPTGAETTAILIVTRYGGTSTYVTQEYQETKGLQRRWLRVLRISYSASSWQQIYMGIIKDVLTNQMFVNGTILRNKLSDAYASLDAIPNGTDLNNLYKEGNYFGLATNSYINCPCSSKNFLLTNNVGDTSGYFVFQTLKIQGTGFTYTRMVDKTIPQNAPNWVLDGVGRDKTVVCFGDSLTEFGTYPQQVSKIFTPNVYNVGFGGTTFSEHTDDGYNALAMYKLVDAIATNIWVDVEAGINDLINNHEDSNLYAFNILKNIDFNTVTNVVMFYGTNDYTNSRLIGANDDTTGATFKGSINHSISTLLTAFPHINITLVTPVFRLNVAESGLNSDEYINAAGLKLSDYRDAIIELAELHHISCLDLNKTSGINQYTADYWLQGDTHPTLEGYVMLGEKIGRYLKTV